MAVPSIPAIATGLNGVAGGITAISEAVSAVSQPFNNFTRQFAGIDISSQNAEKALYSYRRELYEMRRQLALNTKQGEDYNRIIRQTADATILTRDQVLSMTKALESNVFAMRMSTQQQQTLIRTLANEFKERGADMLRSLEQWGQKYPELWEGMFKGMDPNLYSKMVAEMMARGDVEMLRNIRRLNERLAGLWDGEEDRHTRLADSLAKLRTRYQDISSQISESLAPARIQATAAALPMAKVIGAIGGAGGWGEGQVGGAAARLGVYGGLRYALQALPGALSRLHRSLYPEQREARLPGFGAGARTQLDYWESQRDLLGRNRQRVQQLEQDIFFNQTIGQDIKDLQQREVDALQISIRDTEQRLASGQAPLGVRASGWMHQYGTPIITGAATAAYIAAGEYSGAREAARAGETPSVWGGIGTGLLTGAIGGFTVGGPWGAAIGAALGVAIGGVSASLGKSFGELQRASDQLVDSMQRRKAFEEVAAQHKVLGDLTPEQMEGLRERQRVVEHTEEAVRRAEALRVGHEFGAQLGTGDTWEWATEDDPAMRERGRKAFDKLIRDMDKEAENVETEEDLDRFKRKYATEFKKFEYKWGTKPTKEYFEKEFGEGSQARYQNLQNKLINDRIKLEMASLGINEELFDIYKGLQLAQTEWNRAIEWSIRPLESLTMFMQQSYTDLSDIKGMQDILYTTASAQIDEINQKHGVTIESLLEKAKTEEGLNAVEAQMLELLLQQFNAIRKIAIERRQFWRDEVISYEQFMSNVYGIAQRRVAAQGGLGTREATLAYQRATIPHLQEAYLQTRDKYRVEQELFDRARGEGWSESRKAEEGVLNPRELQRLYMEAQQAALAFEEGRKGAALAMQTYVEMWKNIQQYAESEYELGKLHNTSLDQKIRARENILEYSRAELDVLKSMDTTFMSAEERERHQLEIIQRRINIRQRELAIIGEIKDFIDPMEDALSSARQSYLQVLEAYKVPMPYIAAVRKSMLDDSLRRVQTEEYVLELYKQQGRDRREIAQQESKVAGMWADVAQQQDYIRRSWLEMFHEMVLGNMPGGGSYTMPLSFQGPVGGALPFAPMAMYGPAYKETEALTGPASGWQSPWTGGERWRMGPYGLFYQRLLGTPDVGMAPGQLMGRGYSSATAMSALKGSIPAETAEKFGMTGKAIGSIVGRTAQIQQDIYQGMFEALKDFSRWVQSSSSVKPPNRPLGLFNAKTVTR